MCPLVGKLQEPGCSVSRFLPLQESSTLRQEACAPQHLAVLLATGALASKQASKKASKQANFFTCRSLGADRFWNALPGFMLAAHAYSAVPHAGSSVLTEFCAFGAASCSHVFIREVECLHVYLAIFAWFRLVARACSEANLRPNVVLLTSKDCAAVLCVPRRRPCAFQLRLQTSTSALPWAAISKFRIPWKALIRIWLAFSWACLHVSDCGQAI